MRGSIAKASVCPTTLSTARTTAPSTGATSAGGTGFAELHATATTAHAAIGNNDLGKRSTFESSVRRRVPAHSPERIQMS
jgi:hypothetical protein